MNKVYINSLGSISSQKTFDNDIFLEEIIDHEDNVISVVNPNYKEYIPPAAARRMAKGIKMGVVASKIALNEAELENVDAVITGTGMGCVRDSEKFVSNIIDNDEQFLTPTSFIQSTHNTVGAQIALGIQCKGYNFTYVHSSVSFESALLDAKMMLETNESNNILVGGVDELGAHTVKIHKLIHHIKEEQIKASELLKSKTKGAVFSEGANFFVVSNNKKASSYAEVIDITLFNTLKKDSLLKEINVFLDKNNVSSSDIDVVVLGNNGDVEYDDYYHLITKELFAKTQQVYYKHLSGEYNAVSSFGMWLSSKILKSQTIPTVVKMNEMNTNSINNILLYNQYRGKDHSFTLLRRC